jgi:hypothetical protein
MDIKILNKMSKEGREQVIKLEARLAEIQIEKAELDMIEKQLDLLEQNNNEEGFLNDEND